MFKDEEKFTFRFLRLDRLNWCVVVKKQLICVPAVSWCSGPVGRDAAVSFLWRVAGLNLQCRLRRREALSHGLCSSTLDTWLRRLLAILQGKVPSKWPQRRSRTLWRDDITVVLGTPQCSCWRRWVEERRSGKETWEKNQMWVKHKFNMSFVHLS